MDHSLPHPELYNLPFTTDTFQEMPYRNLGASGLRASAIGLGLWKIGYPETGDGSRIGPETAFQILDRAVELGVTFWDTANRYNNASGNSERIIGQWLKAHPSQRRNLVLATKMFGCMDGLTPNHCRLSRSNILDSVYASLDRLQTDHIDLLYFHAFDPTTPIEESLLAVEDLIRADKLRYFGLSNVTAEQLAAYQTVQRNLTDRCRAVAVQNRFDILRGEQAGNEGVLAACVQENVSFVAYSPLAGGLLTDRYLNPSKAHKGDRLVDEGVLEKAADTETLIRLKKLAKMAKAMGCELSQLALAYMLTLPGMGPAIPGVTSIRQLESNAKAGHLQLSEEDTHEIESVIGVKSD